MVYQMMNSLEWSCLLFGGMIFVVGGAAAMHNYKLWHAIYQRLGKEATPELLFEERQKRRRFQQACLGGQGGLLLALSGFALMRWPSWGIMLVFGAILLILWAMAMAVGEIVSINAHYRWMRSRQDSERAQLENEIRKHVENGGNNGQRDANNGDK